ncbi:hypothetical protein [Ectobacillus panaciterrae]|uniref:hypothetical protein n=1 Tax=Ectobacillus panaciterrae TaxID=363872 RepID=UPI0004158A3F|nr:hypothetical protein [Ectobacillus panaciterrae]
MNSIARTVLSYVLFVILPTAIVCALLLAYHTINMQKENEADAQNVYDVKDIVKEVSLIIQSEANLHGVSLLTLMENKPIQIQCSKDHMKQVILNITKNAFEVQNQRFSA